MILNTTRIRTSGGFRNLKNHLLHKGLENERIELLAGWEGDFEKFHREAEFDGCKFSMRHISINAGRPMGNENEHRAVELILSEFNANERPYILVRHTKKLSDGSPNNHLHLIVPERFLGRTMDSKFFKVRNEKISRLLELEFGHQLTVGRHNRAVAQFLSSQGDCSASLLHIAETPRPVASFGAAEHQELKRKGLHLPALKQEVKQAFRDASDISVFSEKLGEMNLVLRRGEKAFVIEHENGTFVGACHRLLKIRKMEFDNLMEEHNGSIAKRHRHNTEDEEKYRRHSKNLGAGRWREPTQSHDGPACRNRHRAKNDLSKVGLNRITDRRLEKRKKEIVRLFTSLGDRSPLDEETYQADYASFQETSSRVLATYQSFKDSQGKGEVYRLIRNVENAIRASAFPLASSQDSASLQAETTEDKVRTIKPAPKFLPPF
ncbi:hypothetical protein UF64_02880 [Thalassospira sp. HJ]|uniref:hypothetical protein n=1 Tax=Thalassospira sp. HJ TaxID=1616823 RepID=UPI0005CDD32D|nr:hypothetical protein [Thalassospira sp. HJ]KJE36641.1 hypothetical protein UF64_02880 [Thalassospira sp. HJ]